MRVPAAEMLAVEELWEGAARGSDRPVIIFNGAHGPRAAVSMPSVQLLTKPFNAHAANRWFMGGGMIGLMVRI